MYTRPQGELQELVFDEEDHLLVDLAEWTLVDLFDVVESSGDLTVPFGLWHVCNLELTEDSYTVTRVMQMIDGDADTQLFPE